MAEKHVEAYLKKRVEEQDGLCLKFVSPGRRGVADRIVISALGFTYYVELKYGKRGKFSPAQIVFRKDLEKRNLEVYNLFTKEDVDRFMDEIYL